MTNAHVLITGGAGFIGRHLTSLLKRQGHWIRWLDTLDPQIHGSNAAVHPSYCAAADDMVLGDVRVRADWQRALEGIDAVIHLAAQTGTGQSMYQVHYYTDVNVGGTALLWDVLANQRTNIRHVVVASSRAIYGEGTYHCTQTCGVIVPQPRMRSALQAGRWELTCPHCGAPAIAIATPETSLPQPASLYACSKLAQEQMSLTMGAALGIPTVALRFQNVFGPGQSLRNPYTGIISIFSNQMRQGIPVRIFEDGLESRDFVYIDDVVRSCALALEMESAKTINIGSGQPTSVIQLAEHLKTIWESDSTIQITGEFRVGDIRHCWADLGKLRTVAPDWRITPLEEGLRHFVNWASTQAVFEDQTAMAMGELKVRNL